MTPENLYNVVCPKFDPYVETGWQKITIKALVERSTGNSEFSFISKAGNKIELNPSDYMPDLSIYTELLEFVSYLNAVENIKCNTIVFEMFPNRTYAFEPNWDEEKHQIDIAYRERLLKSSRKPALIQTTGSIEELKKNYAVTSGTDHNLTRVLMLDSSNKMIGECYTRLFTLFGTTEFTAYEGFAYYIKDQTNELVLGVALTASGLGYYAVNDSEISINALNAFHSFLFSPELEFVDTELTLENDFGQLKIGCLNGCVYAFQVEH